MKVTLDIIERDPTTGEAIKTGEKLLYSASDFGQSCSKWVRETSYKNELVEGILQKSGLSFTETGRGRNSKGSICYLNISGNNVVENAQGVGLYSISNSRGNGLHLYPDNFLRGMTLFTARKSIKGNWINDKDEYVAPTTGDEYKAFEADALVYSLFHGANNCTSCRDIPFKKTTVDIANPMFWRTPDEMRSLADEHHYTQMYADLRGNPPIPHVAKIIAEGVLTKATPLAVKVFQLADALLIDSMKDRAAYSLLHPEYHLDSWDAGNYQLKYHWRAEHQARHDSFREAFKELEDSIVPRVYSLGFLRT